MFPSLVLIAGTLLSSGGVPVSLDLFVSPGCSECERVEKRVVPRLNQLGGDLCQWESHDVTGRDGAMLLFAYAERCGAEPAAPPVLVVDRSRMLCGYGAISTGAVDMLNAAMIDRQREGWQPPPPPEIPEFQSPPDDCADPEDSGIPVDWRMRGMVFLGGLQDGINPCAIATLVFFLSVLSLGRPRRLLRLFTGLGFVAGSFLVYWCIGAGLLAAVRHLPALPLLRRVTNFGMAALLAVLATLSLRDAWRFRKTPVPESVTLKMPESLRTLSRRWISERWQWGGVVLGGALTGGAVTVLESVCTGQGYLPVMAFLAQQPLSGRSVLELLTFYNIAFVIPLVAVLIAFLAVGSVVPLVEWSRRHLPVAKVLMALYFLLLAAAFVFFGVR